MVNWNNRFIELTKHIAGWSKDRSIGVCAVIADKDHRIVSVGYNGFPSGCNDELPQRHERPAKYLFTEHAERNAIYNAARIGVSVKGCTIYLMWFPCADCSRAIIQSGIDTVVCYKPDLTTPKWGEHFQAALQMFEETDIDVQYIDDVTEDQKKRMRGALDWWEGLPMVDHLRGEGWANFCMQYYPLKTDCQDITHDEILYVFEQQHPF